MAGHSKWSNIKRKKEINDVKKSKVFTKLAKEITVASRGGGSDPALNPRLRLALQNAKGANMTKEAILRALNKGHMSDAATYEEVVYEGYVNGVAIIVVCVTDKMIRTVASVRSIFTKYGGRLEKNSSIAFLFYHKGAFVIPIAELEQEDDFTLALIDLGVDTFETEGAWMRITCTVENFGKVQKQMENLNIHPTYSGLEYIPHTLVQVNNEALFKLKKLIEALKDDEDVQHVYHNIAIQSAQQELWEQ